ncbi:SGNH/GDSL hydrolase family protein [Saccharicrinis sp. 156]|uniref:SGNH/GDSL hydrolase family protein n=1 Tax=Saccharicrinis sp. 156 TaxID=3417574 RepID=UPI003D329AB0
MKMIHKIKYALLLLAVVMVSCEVESVDFEASNGEADFINFVAVGDSYTAGYTDGALGLRGQESSFPNIIAGQLTLVGSEGFKQPLVESEGSVSGDGTGYYTLQIVNGSLTPVPETGDMGILGEQVYDASAPIQNLGVPGAKVSHLLAPGYAALNPFFNRFASDPATSVLTDALAANPTFVSLWVGGNDVLAYALEGGEADEVTAPALFAGYYQTVASSIFTGDRKGVVANIPGIDALPYFNSIAYNALEIDQAAADQLNAGYADYNTASDMLGLDRIEFVAGANAFVMEDQDYPHPGKMRQIKAGEKVLLAASSGITDPAMGWGSMAPLGAEYVLDEGEVSAIKAATVEYNHIIGTFADDNDLAHVDLNALMLRASTTGILLDGNLYTSTFVSGGTFSLDGVHTTARGSAIIANAFIDAINKKYDANIPKVNINEFSTVVYP